MTGRHDNSKAPKVAGLTGIAILALASIGGGYVYVTGNDIPGVPRSITDVVRKDSTPPKSDGSTLVQKPSNENLARVTVLVDGWSAKTIQAAGVRYLADPNPAGFGDDNRSKALSLTPVSDADLGALAKTSPEILSQVAARMVTVDPSLRCNAEGCATSSGSLPFGYFTKPSTIPGYGTSYAGYQIDSALYKADLLVPVGTTTIQLEATGYKDYQFALKKAAEVEPAPDGATDEAAPIDSASGFGQDRYLIASAFGRFFVPTASWLGQEADPNGGPLRYASGPVDQAAPTADQIASYTSSPLFAKGLASPVAAATDLGDSKLTYMTSPTTGCQPGVTCIPGVADVTFDRAEPTKTTRACVASGEGAALMVTEASYWTVTYPTPTHQFGVWDGKKVSDFDGASDKPGFFSGGTPPLVSGKQVVRNVDALFFTNDQTPRLWDIIGYTAQEGKDAPADFAVTYDGSNLGDLQGGYFRTC